jgi:hypothetical protein
MARQRHLGVVRAKPPLQPKSGDFARVHLLQVHLLQGALLHTRWPSLARGYSRPRCMMSVFEEPADFQEVAICGADTMSITNVPST